MTVMCQTAQYLVLTIAGWTIERCLRLQGLRPPIFYVTCFSSTLGVEAAQLRGRDRLNLVVEDDTLDDIADIAAVEHMGDIGHRNNDEAAGVG
jgi:hypothetical protein